MRTSSKHLCEEREWIGRQHCHFLAIMCVKDWRNMNTVIIDSKTYQVYAYYAYYFLQFTVFNIHCQHACMRACVHA